MEELDAWPKKLGYSMIGLTLGIRLSKDYDKRELLSVCLCKCH